MIAKAKQKGIDCQLEDICCITTPWRITLHRHTQALKHGLLSLPLSQVISIEVSLRKRNQGRKSFFLSSINVMELQKNGNLQIKPFFFPLKSKLIHHFLVLEMLVSQDKNWDSSLDMLKITIILVPCSSPSLEHVPPALLTLTSIKVMIHLMATCHQQPEDVQYQDCGLYFQLLLKSVLCPHSGFFSAWPNLFQFLGLKACANLYQTSRQIIEGRTLRGEGRGRSPQSVPFNEGKLVDETVRYLIIKERKVKRVHI